MKKTAIILLVFTLLFSLCACSKSDSDKLSGKWVGKYDFTQAVAPSFDSLGIQTPSDSDIAQCGVEFTFKKDGTFSTVIDETGYSNAITNICNYLLEKMAEQAGISVDDLNSTYEMLTGQSFADLIEESLGGIDIADLNSESSTWTLEDGVLTMDGVKVNYTFIDDNTLELSLDDAAAQANPEAALIFPLTLTRG